MNKLHSVVPLVAALLATASTQSCDTTPAPQNNAGEVTYKVADTVTSKCHDRKFAPCPASKSYELETSARNGKHTRFKVSKTVYMRCHLGDAYPACAKGAS